PATLYPVTITGGDAPRWDGRSAWVPKKDLVGAVQATLQSGRLKVVPMLVLAETLRRELLDFQVKVTLAAHEQFGAWREGAHDDLVLAVALAAWLGENVPYSSGVPIAGGARHVLTSHVPGWPTRGWSAF